VNETFFFPDTTVLLNFAAIRRLDLLECYLTGRGRMTQAVRAEVKRSTAYAPQLSMLDVAETFGQVIELSSTEDLRGVVAMRRRFAVPGDPATKHLGESETLHVMTTRPEYHVSRFVTEDRAAQRVAENLGVLVHTTMGVFRELVARGEVTEADGFAMLHAIEAESTQRVLIERPSRPSELRV
jgi:predicted nucleic acid-binding protein